MEKTSSAPISRGHDNLFVYRKTKPFDTMEDNELVAKRLSSEADKLTEKATLAEVNMDTAPWPFHLLWAVLLLLLLPIQWLIETLLPEVHHDFWGRIIYYSIIGIFFLIVLLVNKKSNKQRAIIIAASTAAVRTELGIPEAAREIDILPYIYKKTKKGPTPNRKDGRFDNIPVCIWREGESLCLSDEDALIRFPVKAIGEIREVQRKVHISAWYKAHTYDSPTYKAYTKDNFWSGIDILTYFEVEIRDDNGIKYLLIPNYDVRTFRELADSTHAS